MITCVVRDSAGNELGSFAPKGEQNILDEAMDHGIEIPFSCHAGACTSCATQILEGEELFEQEKDGPVYMETEEGIYLTCVGGVRAEDCKDDVERKLVLQLA